MHRQANADAGNPVVITAAQTATRNDRKRSDNPDSMGNALDGSDNVGIFQSGQKAATQRPFGSMTIAARRAVDMPHFVHKRRCGRPMAHAQSKLRNRNLLAPDE